MKYISIFSIVIAFWGVGFLLGLWCESKAIEKEEPQIISELVDRPLTEWQIMTLALIKTESSFNTLAVGNGGDWGVLQITPIYVKEVNRILGEEGFIHEDAFNPEKSIEMFNIMQSRHNPNNDIDRAITSHNPTATSAYLIKVRKNMEEIRKYEELRRMVYE